MESSKSARREQTDEFERQVKEIAAAHEKELKSVSAAHDEEKRNVSEAAQQQRDTLISNHKQVLMSKKTQPQTGTRVTKHNHKQVLMSQNSTTIRYSCHKIL